MLDGKTTDTNAGRMTRDDRTDKKEAEAEPAAAGKPGDEEV